MTYKQEAEESLDDFVSRCRRMTQRCLLIEHEQQQQIIEFIIASTPIADFQKEWLRKDNSLTLEETVCIGKTYEASNIHIKQLRAMVNDNNNVDNTNIQVIRTPTRSTMSNNCLKCGKSHAFHRDACPAFGSKCNTCGKANHWVSVCLSNGTKLKQRPRSQSRKYKEPKSHYQPQYRRKQDVKTGAVYNNKEAEEQMESMTFNCINMTQRNEVFVLINIKLPNRNGIHNLRLKIDTRAQGNTQPVSTFRRLFPEKLDADGFPNTKKQFSNKKLIAYNGTPIKCFGNIKIPCQYNKSDWHVITFHIVDVQRPAVLGLRSLEQLKLITLHCTVKKEYAFITPAATRINATKDLMPMYPNQFEKIGSMPGAVRLSVNENIHPHIDTPRKTPIELKDNIWGPLNKFPDFFRMGAFIDSTHMEF